MVPLRLTAPTSGSWPWRPRTVPAGTGAGPNLRTETLTGRSPACRLQRASDLEGGGIVETPATVGIRGDGFDDDGTSPDQVRIGVLRNRKRRASATDELPVLPGGQVVEHLRKHLFVGDHLRPLGDLDGDVPCPSGAGLPVPYQPADSWLVGDHDGDHCAERDDHQDPKIGFGAHEGERTGRDHGQEDEHRADIRVARRVRSRRPRRVADQASPIHHTANPLIQASCIRVASRSWRNAPPQQTGAEHREDGTADEGSRGQRLEGGERSVQRGPDAIAH